MNVEVWLKKSALNLTKSGIATSRLDSLVLLEDITGKDRSWLLAHPDFVLEAAQIKLLEKMIGRRAKHEPLAYIRGKSEFYGREFLITPDTLQPRPESETLITLLKNILQHNSSYCTLRAQSKGKDDITCVLVDVGTGSGCLAITAKLELPEAEVYATEINNAALEIARKNAIKFGADIGFYKGNLLDPVLALGIGPLAILANLPYVPDSHTINKAAMQEPKIAIFGGPDGLDLYRELFFQITKFAEKPQFIFTESLPFQHDELCAIAGNAGFHQTNEEDFIQVFEKQ